jgi:hypothetical protein
MLKRKLLETIKTFFYLFSLKIKVKNFKMLFFIKAANLIKLATNILMLI